MRVVDLSHPLTDDMAVYPGDPAVEIARCATLQPDGYRLTRLGMGVHSGTHVDAPAHLLEHGAGLDEFAPERFVGAGLVVDVSGLDVIRGEHLEGVRPELVALSGGFALLRTGWSEHFGTKEYYRNWPHLDESAARLLAACPLSGIGLDTPSPDPASTDLSTPDLLTPDLAAHRILFKAGLLIVENLTALQSLPCSGFTFCCAPLPLAGTEASPVRALALVAGE